MEKSRASWRGRGESFDVRLVERERFADSPELVSISSHSNKSSALDLHFSREDMIDKFLFASVTGNGEPLGFLRSLAFLPLTLPRAPDRRAIRHPLPHRLPPLRTTFRRPHQAYREV